MYKLNRIKSSSGFGILGAPGHSGTRLTTVLEKHSEARCGQADWMGRVDRIDPRIRAWIQREEMDHDRYTYVLVVPLGSDESWEETVNGDAFERSHLEVEHPEYGHKTFERYAKAYLHHKNKNPEIGYGDHPLMVFNRQMDRCEGIWRLDNEKARSVGAAHVIERILGDRPVEISMGTKVPYDVCSLCGNKAKTPREYCSHVKSPGFGHIDPDTGEKMRVFNPFPKFFDLSAVVIPAAPEALVLGRLSPELAAAVGRVKQSSHHLAIVPASVLGAQMWGYDEESLAFSKTSSRLRAEKVSDLIKEVPALAAEVIRPLTEEEEGIDSDALDEAGVKSSSLPAVLSTFAALGIPLGPGEFCDVLAKTEGAPTEGRTISRDLIAGAFPSAPPMGMVSSGAFSPGLASRLRYLVPGRSVLLPHLGSRVAGSSFEGKKPEKRVEVRISVEGFPLHELYASYIKAIALQAGSLIRSVLETYPDHLDRNLLARDLTVLPPDGLMGEAEKVSDLSAQALFPALCILEKVGQARDPAWALRVIKALNVPGVEPLTGGVLQ